MAAAAKKKMIVSKKTAVPVSKKTVAKVAAKKPAEKTVKTVKLATKTVKVATKDNVALLKQVPRLSVVSQMSRPAANNERLPASLQNAVDKQDVADVLAKFARGIDRLDETLLRSLCHPDASFDMGPGVFQGTAGDYVQWLLGVMQQVKSSHHMVANMHAEIEGDVALVESYCQAHFRLDKPTGREDVFLGSRFLDRMERRPTGPAGVWKLMHRKQIFDWVRTEPVSDIFYHQNPDALWSFRTKADPSYQMAQFPGSQQDANKLPAFLGRRFESKSIKF